MPPVAPVMRIVDGSAQARREDCRVGADRIIFSLCFFDKHHNYTIHFSSKPYSSYISIFYEFLSNGLARAHGQALRHRAEDEPERGRGVAQALTH
jgi:hypothetical protein